MNFTRKYTQGFTIVELLIVVVVIAILAAITIVAYNGITDRSKTSMISDGLASYTQKLMAVRVDDPADNFVANLNAAGLSSNSGGVAYTYTASVDGKSFCLQGVMSGKSRFITSANGSAQAGTCNGAVGVPGSGIVGPEVITNLIPNPSFEQGIAGWTGLTVSFFNQGTGSGAGITGTRYANWQVMSFGSNARLHTDPIAVEAGQAYTFASWELDSNFAGDMHQIYIEWLNSGGSAISTAASGHLNGVTGTWKRASVVGAVAPANAATARLYIQRQANASYSVRSDSVMFYKGTTLIDYFDGDTPDTSSYNYEWTGSQGASTSTRTAL